MSKKVLAVIFISIFLVLGLFFCVYSSVIFQEGNPWAQIKGIAQLNFSNKAIVKLSNSDDKYITKSKNGKDAVTDFMQTKDYEFVEQMGSGYLFQSPTGKKIVITRRQYSHYYSLWNIPQNIEQAEASIAEQLQECLPKSDMVSHEKCNELLATINNFDDCVNAGFSIMKSNPLQCTALDGRFFIQGVNSTWETALTAINNCEVEKAFQTHSKIVTLKLKNGNELTAYEPEIDDIIKILEKLEPKCGSIVIGTE
jgi:hypothetical protein